MVSSRGIGRIMADRTSIDARRDALADVCEALGRAFDAGAVRTMAGKDAAHNALSALTRLAFQAEDDSLADAIERLRTAHGV